MNMWRGENLLEKSFEECNRGSIYFFPDRDSNNFGIQSYHIDAENFLVFSFFGIFDRTIDCFGGGLGSAVLSLVIQVVVDHVFTDDDVFVRCGGVFARRR